MASPQNNEGSGSPLQREADISSNKSQSPAAAHTQDLIARSEQSGSLPPEYSLSPEELTEEPETVNNIFQLLGGRLMGGPGMGQRDPAEDNMSEKLKELHPFSTSLGFSDIESCIKLEESAASDATQACSRELITYHLSNAGELSFGLFTSADPASPHRTAATAETAKPIDSSVPSRKGVLLAQIISTKSTNEQPTDDDYLMPSEDSKPGVGHNEEGRTIIIQSLAVLPAFQGRGLGAVILKAYMQRMSESLVADRIAVLVQPDHVGFYEKFGFENEGPSNVKRGHGEMVVMGHDFEGAKSDEEEEEEI